MSQWYAPRRVPAPPVLHSLSREERQNVKVCVADSPGQAQVISNSGHDDMIVSPTDWSPVVAQPGVPRVPRPLLSPYRTARG